MAKTSSDKIILRRLVDYPFENAILNEAASPGHLVELLSTGKIQKNDSGFADGIGILVENESLNGEKTTAYASGDIATYSNLISGMIVQARIAAGADAITKGDRVTVTTGGTVVKLTVPADLTDNSGGTASNTLADITEANNAGSADRVPTENAIASLAAKVNAILPTGVGYLGIALESVDNSGGSSEAFIQIRIK